MGVASWLGFVPKPLPPAVVTAQPIIEVVLDGIKNQSVEKLWREQPHLRTVVGFVARSVASLGWHAYQRDGDDGRVRMRHTVLSELLRQPNAQMTGYELVYATVADLCLYDSAFWWAAQDATGTWTIRQIPPTWVVGTTDATPFSYGGYEIAPPNAVGRKFTVPAKDMVVFHGWDPVDPRRGVSPVEALKSILAEQIHAQIYRDQKWTRGGRVGTYLSRPADAPKWSDEARSRFAKAWRSKYSGDDAPEAGGEPILEDGMKLERAAFSAREDQYVESSKLSLTTVAQVYHVNPTMVGLLDNANYSNVREFRRMLYGDTLGPLLEMIQQRVNAFLVPKIVGDADVYVEFNIQSKLSGSFEEQASVMQTAIGAPWMTVNEGRAKQNLPAVDGGDALVVPLNVTQNGDQNPVPASPPEETQ